MSTTKTGNIPPERHALHELAGEYVLGTLSAARRREVEARLADDLQLQAAVHAWEDRLLPLTGLVEPVAPSPRLWARIERSLDALATPAPQPVRRPAPRRLGWRWDSLALWRGLTAGGFALATVLAAVLAQPQRFAGRNVGLVLSGGNVDLDALPALLATATA